jgi:hypothetical protein
VYRPYALLVLEQERGLIRRVVIHDERPTADAVLEALIKAMRRPIIGSGRRDRPARVLLDDADLGQALAPQLAEIGIQCDHRPTLPLIDATVRELADPKVKQEQVPGLLSVAGATEPLIHELFAAAADYYRRAPWRWMENFWPIEIRYPAHDRGRYALVLGSGGEFFGLSLYESVEDLRVALTNLEPERTCEQISWFSLVFGDVFTMTFDDLDAIEKYDWPVAGERAYPATFKTVPPGAWGVPSASELAWLAAAMRVIPDFAVERLQADQGLPRPAEAVYSLPNVHGGQDVALRYPVSLRDPAEQELEEYIEDWYWDGPSHEFAHQVGALLFEFIDHLDTTGLSERTLRRHESNCWTIGYLECHYGYHDTFSPEIFLSEPSFVYEFKRKLSDSEHAVASYKATWRKLARYVRSLGYGE